MAVHTIVKGDRANAWTGELLDPNDPVSRRDISGDSLAFTLTSEKQLVKESNGTVLKQQIGNGIFAITAITNAYPAQVTVSSASGLTENDRGVIERVSGMTEINGVECEVSSLSGNNFDARDVDSRAFGAYATASGLFINRGFVAITFTAAQVNEAGEFRLQIIRTTGASLTAHYPVLHEEIIRVVEPKITVR